MEALTPTNIRKNLYKVIQKVNEDSKPILVTPANGEKDKSAVIVSQSDWDSIEETMGLIKGGLLQTLEARKDAGYVELPEGIYWDKVD